MMTGFLDPVDVRALPDGKNWLVLHEVRYATRMGRVIYVPADFITDFASIPWFFRRLFQPATGKHRRAALVHDWIYRTPDLRIDKSEADSIFRDIMLGDGLSEWKVWLMYNAVRFGGAGSYKPRVPKMV